MSNKKGYEKKLVKNTMVFAIGNFSTRVLIFLLVPLYTRTLSTEEYGVIDLIFSSVSLMLPIFSLNIHEAVLRYSLESGSNPEEIFSIGLTTILIGLLPVTIASYFITKFLNIGSYYLALVLTYAVTALKQLLMYYSRGKQKVKLIVVVSIADTLLLLALNIFFLYIMKLGLRGYYISLLISSLISIGIFYKFLSINIGKAFCLFKKMRLKEMLKYSIPMIPNSISWWLSNASDKYFMNTFRGIGETGVYSIAYKVPSLLNTVTKIFMDAWQISSAEEYEQNNEGSFSEVYRLYFGTSILICAVLTLFTKPISIIMFSPAFQDAAHYVPILLVAFLFNGLASFYGSIYTASKMTNMLMISTGSGAILSIILYFVLIPAMGGLGASISTLVCYIVVFVIRQTHSKRIVKIEYSIYKQILQFLIFFILTVVWSLVPQTITITKLLISFTVIAVLMYMNWVVVQKAKNALLSVLKKIRDRKLIE